MDVGQCHIVGHGFYAALRGSFDLVVWNDKKNQSTYNLEKQPFLLDMQVYKNACEDAKETGAKIQLVNDPFEAAKDADIVVTDTWASMGQEAEHDERKKIFKDYQVNEELLKVADKRVIVMHCLPAYRGEEITDDVLEAYADVIFDEAENRLHTQKAIMALTMG